MNPIKFILAALRSAGVFGLHLGSSGGGGQAASQTQVSDLPEWAKPYAKETLGKTQALTDIEKNPYQTYSSERIAGFDPMQQQSFQGAAQMQPSALGAQAGQLAGAATMGALGTNYNPYETGGFTSQTAAQYMNPYLEQAMEPQLREAQRASQMQGVVDQGQAVRSGAFGGSRQGIVEAERQRNLGQLQGDIRAKGYMSAFEQAQQNFAREQALREQSRQYGAGLGLQGLQTAITGAGQMGALGGQEFAQGMDINKLQNLYGGQRQAQEQAELTQKYQDFQSQKRYPYQQLEFMSNILRGTPMGTVNTMYQAPPSIGQQIGALGAGAYGASKLFADGGAVGGYAEGGVTSDQNVESILSKLSNEQLAQAKQIAVASQDMERVQMIDQELAERASMSQGLGGAFNQLPQEAQQNVIQAANGGMLSFAGDDRDNDPRTGQLVSAAYAPGSEADYKYFLGAGRKSLEALQQPATYATTTPEEQAKFRTDYLAKMQEGAGESPYAQSLKQVETERAGLSEAMEKAKGIGALRAAGALLKGRGLAQGLGMAGEAFADTYEKAEAAQRAEKRALSNMQLHLTDAQRKERMGLNKDATAALREVERDKVAALKAKNDRLKAEADLAGRMAQASKPYRPVTPRSGEAKPPKGFDALADAEYKGLIAAGEKPGAETRRVAFRNAADIWGRQTGQQRTDVGMAGVTSRLDLKVMDAVNKARFTPEYVEAATPEAKQAVLDRAEAEARKRITTEIKPSRPTASNPAASAPVNPNSTRAVNPATVQGLPPGATVRGNEVFDSAGKLIGHVK